MRLSGLVCFALVLALLAPFTIAAPPKEKPPMGINAHYDWCGKPKAAAAQLERYEGFWRQHLPERDDEYNDHTHVNYVRRCAYRLASLYLQTDQKEKGLKMIKWLEANDGTFPENAQ